MGLVANSLRIGVQKAAAQWQPAAPFAVNRAQLPDNKYQTFAKEGYMGNELIYACIEELSTSAAEPALKVKVNGAWKTEGDRLLDLLTRPNPFMDRYEFVATIIMHRSLAGNAYALKVRSASQRTVQLWLIRPDRVRVVPLNGGYDRRYDVDIGGGDFVSIPSSDILHFKTRHPLNDFYGMPPLMPISGRTDIDNYMRDFVKAYFSNAGVPGGVLSVKQTLSDEQKTSIRNRFRETVGGPNGWHEILIIDNNETTFTPMTQQIGTKGLVIPELDEINEARIPMVFGVPQSLIGTRTSYQNGGYANKRAEEQHFWAGTLSPLYKELVGPMNLNLIDEFRVQEIAFDLSDVRALQADDDALSVRVSNEYIRGLRSKEEGRVAIGLPAQSDPNHSFLIPSGTTPTMGDDPVPEPDPVAVPSGGPAN